MVSKWTRSSTQYLLTRGELERWTGSETRKREGGCRERASRPAQDLKEAKGQKRRVSEISCSSEKSLADDGHEQREEAGLTDGSFFADGRLRRKRLRCSPSDFAPKRH
jgi:hypothetical protein